MRLRLARREKGGWRLGSGPDIGGKFRISGTGLAEAKIYQSNPVVHDLKCKAILNYPYASILAYLLKPSPKVARSSKSRAVRHPVPCSRSNLDKTPKKPASSPSLPLRHLPSPVPNTMLLTMFVHYLLSLVLLLGLAVNAQTTATTTSAGTSISPRLTVPTAFDTARFTIPSVDTAAFGSNGIIPLGGSSTTGASATAAGTTGKSSSDGGKICVSRGQMLIVGAASLFVWVGYFV